MLKKTNKKIVTVDKKNIRLDIFLYEHFNAISRNRIKNIADQVNLNYSYKASKPSRRELLNYLTKTGESKSLTLHFFYSNQFIIN